MAKILIVSVEGYGLPFTLRLEEEGHNVSSYLLKKDYKNILRNIIDEPMLSKPDFAKYDLVIFDVTGNPKLAEEAIESAPTIGDGNLPSMLEDDREFGIQVMENVGISVPPYEEFDDVGEAKRFIKKTNKRYVFKPHTIPGEEQDSATTYVAKSPEDLIEYLDKLRELSGGASFILQEFIEGTEVSVEGWFNGTDFCFINGTLETKKFMDNNRGPNTGCSGNLMWVMDDLNKPTIFREGLGKMREFLSGTNFRGMIDLNTIVTPTKAYGLEWTPRFGYDSSYTLFSLVEEGLGDFFGNIATGQNIKTPSTRGIFSAGIRVSIPPYPSVCKGFHQDGVPIKGIEPDDAIQDCYLYDAMLDRRDDLVSAGVSGLIAVPTGFGDTPEKAFGRCQERLDNIQVPDMQYRGDVYKEVMKRYNTLREQGWLR